MLFILFKLLMVAIFTGATTLNCQRVLANKSSGFEHGVSRTKIYGAVFATLLVLIPVFGISAPTAFPQNLFRPIPYIFLFLLPAILLTTPLIKRLETTGTNTVEELERALKDCRMLAYFGLIYVLLVWGIYLFMAYQSSPERMF